MKGTFEVYEKRGFCQVDVEEEDAVGGAVLSISTSMIGRMRAEVGYCMVMKEVMI